VTSIFTYTNGTGEIIDVNSIIYEIVESNLLIDVEWNTTSGDVFRVTLSIQHAQYSTFPADNIMIVAQFAPYFILIPSTLTSTEDLTVLRLFTNMIR
jgi:hypothetical protein